MKNEAKSTRKVGAEVPPTIEDTAGWTCFACGELSGLPPTKCCGASVNDPRGYELGHLRRRHRRRGIGWVPEGMSPSQWLEATDTE